MTPLVSLVGEADIKFAPLVSLVGEEEEALVDRDKVDRGAREKLQDGANLSIGIAFGLNGKIPKN